NLNSGFVDLTDESSYYSSVLKEMILSNPIANDVAFAEKPEELLNIFIEDKNLNFNEFTNLILDVTIKNMKDAGVDTAIDYLLKESECLVKLRNGYAYLMGGHY